MRRALVLMLLATAVIMLVACGKVGNPLRSDDGTPVPLGRSYPPQ